MSILSLFSDVSTCRFSVRKHSTKKHHFRIKRTGPPPLKKKDDINYPIFIPKISVHPDKINLYNEIAWSHHKPQKKTFEHLLTSDRLHHGKVSKIARQKVSKAVNYLLFMANDKRLPETEHGKGYMFKIAFITLTLPSKQIHSDSEIKELLLNQFLIELRKYENVKNYLWRAEKQKNGNIHFHILVDRFICWSSLRDRWNRITNKLGYCDRYREDMHLFHSSGFKVREDLLNSWEYKKQVKAYQHGKANDWNSPNSTDIHSLKHVTKAAAYILKYCTKDEQNANIDGRLWGCSEQLSNISGAVTIEDNGFSREICFLEDNFPEKFYYAKHFVIISISVIELFNYRCMRLFTLFSQFLLSSFNFNIQTVLPC